MNVAKYVLIKMNPNVWSKILFSILFDFFPAVEMAGWKHRVRLRTSVICTCISHKQTSQNEQTKHGPFSLFNALPGHSASFYELFRPARSTCRLPTLLLYKKLSLLILQKFIVKACMLSEQTPSGLFFNSLVNIF